VASDRKTFRTTFREIRISRQIALIVFPWTKYARRIFATVSTTNIPIKAPVNKGSHREPQRQRGPFWTPITPLTGSFFHAETQAEGDREAIIKVIDAMVIKHQTRQMVEEIGN
jgi:hypothetical protein